MINKKKMFYPLWQDKRHFLNDLCDVNSVVCHEIWKYITLDLEKIYRNIVLLIILIGMNRLTCAYNIASYLMLTQY